MGHTRTHVKLATMIPNKTGNSTTNNHSSAGFPGFNQPTAHLSTAQQIQTVQQMEINRILQQQLLTSTSPKVLLTNPSSAGIVALPVNNYNNLTQQQLQQAGMEIVYVPSTGLNTTPTSTASLPGTPVSLNSALTCDSASAQLLNSQIQQTTALIQTVGQQQQSSQQTPSLPVLNQTPLLKQQSSVNTPVPKNITSPGLSELTNEEQSDSSAVGGGTGGYPTQFVSILKRMLDENTVAQYRTADQSQPLFSWSESGNSILIRNSRTLFPKMMANFFSTTDINSFIRQLNHYGFAKIKRVEDQNLKARMNQDKTLEFQHPDFRRDNMCNLKRRKRDSV